MALANGSYFTCTATATTGNVNAAGFNPNNANMLTDLACDAGTGNTASPVVSSASYNFVSGDVGNWVYIKSGTNWTPGWYQIASVASNKATLKAAVGEAQQVSLGFKALNTVAGCATVGTPTGGTFAIDYSQVDTAIATATDITCTAASTTVSSASAPFKNVMAGNIIHFTALTGTGAITGWYEIVSVSSTTSAVLDRTPTNGVNNITAGTYYIGGAGRLNGLEDAFLESFSPGSKLYVKAGTYNTSGVINISTGIGTYLEPITYLAYTTIPGDFVAGNTRPFINTGVQSTTLGAFINMFDWEMTGTGANVIVTIATNFVARCKFTNTSNTAGRGAMTGLGWFYDCEAVSQFGYAVAHSGSGGVVKVRRCYIHDSLRGMSLNSTASVLTDNVISNCTEVAITNTTNSSSSNYTITNNTIYGRSSSPVGVGLNLPTAGVGTMLISGNIISGCATGISVGTQANSIMGTNNNFYNNTTDVTNYLKSQTDTALDPQFTDITEISISDGTITGGTAVLTSATADFSSVEDGVDYFTWISHTGGTGTFVGSYLITAHTTTTLTFNINAGTSGSVTGVTGYIQTGHNFTPGANMKNKWGAVQPTYTSYIDVGGVQRQETGGSSTTVGWASQS